MDCSICRLAEKRQEKESTLKRFDKDIKELNDRLSEYAKFKEKLNEKFEGKELYADCKRELFIPEPLDEDELYDYNVMTVLGIDKPTLQKLCDYLDEQEQNGIEVTYDMIGKWVFENS